MEEDWEGGRDFIISLWIHHLDAGSHQLEENGDFKILKLGAD
jgi:hypothetical protein